MKIGEKKKLIGDENYQEIKSKLLVEKKVLFLQLFYLSKWTQKFYRKN